MRAASTGTRSADDGSIDCDIGAQVFRVLFKEGKWHVNTAGDVGGFKFCGGAYVQQEQLSLFYALCEFFDREVLGD